FACFAIAGRKEALDHYDASMKRLIGDPNDSLSDAVNAMAIADKEYVESINAHEARYFLEGILMPDFSKFMHLWKLDQARRDACAAAIAAELYHRAIINGLRAPRTWRHCATARRRKIRGMESQS
ncbi:MAG: hypothetical protein EBQ83_09865, partial [Burkholderiaceae bacterium]|nr:hypothetical protein [Burkholderiaceae bacterium]